MNDQAGDILDKLKSAGFFEQMESLQSNIGHLAEDISRVGESATQRLEEMESMAAHIMAMESVLAVMLKSHPIDTGELKAEVARRTSAVGGDENGSPTVQAVAADIVSS